MTAPPAWFDSHSHLYELGGDDAIAAAVERAQQAGVVGMCLLGVDQATSVRAIELATAHRGIVAGAAYHPTACAAWRDSWADRVDELLHDERAVAVGETGLDYHWDTSFVDLQERAFAAHIALAKQRDKALVVHTRASVTPAIEMLERQGPPDRTVFHCWSGSRAELDRALALGAYVSFAGNVSFKNAHGLREIAARVPEERLLVETDSPYLAPVPHRGERNEPAFVPLVGAAVAAARDDDASHIAEVTTANALLVFGLG